MDTFSSMVTTVDGGEDVEEMQDDEGLAQCHTNKEIELPQATLDFTGHFWETLRVGCNVVGAGWYLASSASSSSRF